MTDSFATNGAGREQGGSHEIDRHRLIDDLLRLAHEEDVGGGDLSAALLQSPDAPATFRILMKQPGVFAGCEVIPRLLPLYGGELSLDWAEGVTDGWRMSEGMQEVGTVKGPVGSILTMERVMLNVLQRLCGVATVTRRFVDAVAGTTAEILDTRKTIPGWRVLDKYAVRCGGGRNHRMGLHDAVMIKDNHFSGAEGRLMAAEVFHILNRLLESRVRPAFVEVEVDDIEQMESVMSVLGVDVILLDNFDPDELRQAVEMRDGHGLRGKIALEASGGIDLSSVRAVAETGVDRISVGALTHSAPAIDLSLERVT